MVLCLQTSQNCSISYVAQKTIQTGPEKFKADDEVSEWLRRPLEKFKRGKSPLETLQILSYLLNFSGFEDVLLSGFRALSEQQPIAEDYSSFK